MFFYDATMPAIDEALVFAKMLTNVSSRFSVPTLRQSYEPRNARNDEQNDKTEYSDRNDPDR